MTYADLFLLAALAICAVGVVLLRQRDRSAGRHQVRSDISGRRLLIGVSVFAAFGLAIGTFAILEITTPGTTVLTTGRLQGAEVHHRTLGLIGACVSALVFWLAATMVAATRQRPPAPSPGATPARPTRPAPTRASARAAWITARQSPDPDPALLSEAAKELARALEEPLPQQVAQPMALLIAELDRARFAGTDLDLELLDVCFERIDRLS